MDYGVLKNMAEKHFVKNSKQFVEKPSTKGVLPGRA